MVHKMPTDVPACSQSVGCGKIGSSTSDDVKTCLQLLYKIFTRAVFALTLNKYVIAQSLSAFVSVNRFYYYLGFCFCKESFP